MLHQPLLSKKLKQSFFVIFCCFSLEAQLVFATSIYRYEDEAGHTVYTNVPPKGKEAKDKKMRLVTEAISIIPGGYTGRPGIILPTPGGIPSSSHHRHAEPLGGSRTTDSLEGIPSQVDPNIQQGRDATRKSILLNELNTERQALSEAQKQLQTSNPPPEPIPQKTLGTSGAPGLKIPGVNTLQQTIESHERNINALQRELGQR